MHLITFNFLIFNYIIIIIINFIIIFKVMKFFYYFYSFDDSNRIFRIEFRIKLNNLIRILKFICSIRLEYSNSILKIESSKFKSSTRLKIEFSTRRDQSTLVLFERGMKI